MIAGCLLDGNRQKTKRRRNPQGIGRFAGLLQRPDETAQKYRGGGMLTATAAYRLHYLRFVGARICDYVNGYRIGPQRSRLSADHPEVATRCRRQPDA